MMADVDGGARAPEAGGLACVEGEAAGSVVEAAGGDGDKAVQRAKRRYVRTDYLQKVRVVSRACRWIEAGWSVADVCREPDMPGRTTFTSWLTSDGELRGMVEAAQAQAARLFTTRREYHRWDPEVAAEVLARIEDGKGLREVCAERDMPAHATVLRWIRERPAYEAAYRRAREAQADRLFDVAWRIACEAEPGDLAVARLKIQTLKWRVGKLAPRVYGPVKAQDAEGGGGRAGDRRAQGRVVAIEVREFAATPDGRVLDITSACRGRSEAACRALFEDIAAGRIGVAEVAALNAAAEAGPDRGGD